MIDVDYNEYKDTLARNMELIQENHKLKELCNKYEEEHKNEFETWKKATKRIDKAIEYIENHKEETIFRFIDDKSYNAELLDVLEILREKENGN